MKTFAAWKPGHLLFRLFLTYFATAAVLIGAVFVAERSLQMPQAWPNFAEAHLMRYLRHLNEEILRDPTPAQAHRVLEHLGLDVLVWDKDRAVLDTLKLGAPPKPAHRGLCSHFADIECGHMHHHLYLRLRGTEPSVYWFLPARHAQFLHFPAVPLIAFIVFILGMSFITIRMLMRPMRLLVDGVEKIASGDLSFRYDLRARGEFSTLAEAFNRMADRIQGMVEAKDRMLRDVSHELRSPLTRMGVAVELLHDAGAKSSLRGDLVEMNALVADLLESYRLRDSPDLLRRETIDMRECVGRIVGEYAESAPGVRLAAGEAFSFSVDPMRFERVLRNLIENALKYSAGASAPVEVELRVTDAGLHLRVRDHGPGIALADQARIFEPFYRVDDSRTRSTGGYGLGLSIVRSVVEAHGGRVRVESAPGAGAAFCVELPNG